MAPHIAALLGYAALGALGGYLTIGVGFAHVLVGPVIILFGAVIHLLVLLRGLRREVRALRDAQAKVAAQSAASAAGLHDLQAALGFDGSEGTADLIEEMRTIKSLLRKMTDRAAAVRDRQDGVLGRAAAASVVSEMLSDDQVLDIVRSAIESNRVDLYLQPIVTLPQRKVRFYEAFGRIRTEKGSILLPEQYRPVAIKHGLLPTIENLLLFRCVQSVRRAWKEKLEVGFFCNLAREALLDAEFYPQFIEFLGRNKDLSESLVFEIAQDDVEDAALRDKLDALRKLGFWFSLDTVTRFTADATEQRARIGFRYLKVAADDILSGRAANNIHIADWTERLKRFGMSLIAEQVEEDSQTVALMEINVELAQGTLLGEPRPLREKA